MKREERLLSRMIHIANSGQPEVFKNSSFTSALDEDEIFDEKDYVFRHDSRHRQRRIYSPAHFSYEWIRRATFDSWSVDYVSKDDLAKAGFFYLRTKDLVQCFFCKGVVGYWEHGDSPFTEHEKHFPGCPFVQGQLTSNVPLVPPEEGQKKNLSSLLNGILQYALKYNKPPLPANRLQTDAILSGQPNECAYPVYSSMKNRMFTFRNWPKANVPSAEKMMKAGFFYTGLSDFVMCFTCGGGLFNWTADDDPFADHLNYYDHCSFGGSKVKKEKLEISEPTWKLSEEDEELLLQYSMSKKLKEMGLSPYSIKGALKEYLESRFYLPGTLMSCTDVVVEWDEKQKQLHEKNSQVCLFERNGHM